MKFQWRRKHSKKKYIKNDEEKEFDIRKESENVIKEELNKDVSLIGLRFVFVSVAHQDQRM